ncbi:FAD:protein FMN transferase [Pontiella desulfatans]|uniref:FAD:protein FMN transferase n=1 Tax=Pontiella desulfatans TaxID=2750659 RepID=A0A6C2TZ24_PONDE|nr:FAD:protein FMN transferase [Pontiella desulfatans]VGO12863.1 FAD:protein FMN transferase [Pontiella desulfatans]
MPRKKIIQIILGLVLVLVLGIGGYLRSQVIVNPAHWGETMGTGYSIKITGKVKQSKLQELTRSIDDRLAEINRQMSTWDPESEISRFNHSDSLEPFECSDGFVEVVRRALELSESTGGAFDPTLQPLLNLWGFGSEADGQRVPTDAEIAAIRETIGWRMLTVEGRALRKAEPGLSLALGAIAKGYGVDALAKILKDAGFENWFVEIGGEVLVRGLNPDGVPWKIGIQFPTTNPMDQSLQGIVHLTEGAIATSGDYRNYVRENDEIYSHILDPRSGRAVRSDTASVSVMAANCMDADGIATALFVLGADEGIAWVEGETGVEAMFLLRDDDGQIIERFSSGFQKATRYNPAL